MYNASGRLLGKPRTTSSEESVPGLWTMQQQIEAKRASLWPLNLDEDPNFANVSLLLHGDGANGSTTIIDSSPSPKTVTAVGDAQISTAQSKFGGASIAFDGAQDYILPSASNDYAFGSNDFTIELWVNSNSISNNGILQLSTVSGGFSTSYTNGLALVVAGNLFYALGGILVNSGVPVSTGNWDHVAMARQNSLLKVFLNGTSIVSATNATNVIATNLVIGGYYSSLYTLNGYIDDLRITKGVARYTSSFTPPTAPFPDA